MDTTFGSFLLLEQVEGNMAQNSKVFGSLVFADPTVIFMQGDIQNPVQIIFNRPVFANSFQNPLGVAG